MAGIIEATQSCDGYVVSCLLSNDERITFHWPEKPADVQAATDAQEAAHLARLAAEEEAEIELEIVPE